MENGNPSPSERNVTWRPLQAFLMAGICFVIGVTMGFLIRGPVSAATSTPTGTAVQNSNVSMPGLMQQGQMPSMEQMKHMAEKQAEPLMERLKTEPRNAELWDQVGLIYKTTHQFRDAEVYLQKSLDIDPGNLMVRADLASCMYYAGDVDGALAQLQKSLTYDPRHAGTLLNIGIIKLNGKHDVDGAIAAWQELLKQNPNYEQKDRVQRMILQARRQQAAVN